MTAIVPTDTRNEGREPERAADAIRDDEWWRFVVWSVGRGEGVYAREGAGENVLLMQTHKHRFTALARMKKRLHEQRFVPPGTMRPSRENSPQ